MRALLLFVLFVSVSCFSADSHQKFAPEFLVFENGVRFCPMSSPLFDELMGQDDDPSREMTAALMDELSQGICLRFASDMAELEWDHYVWTECGLLESEVSPNPWTSIGFRAAQYKKFTDPDL
ncbi:MAG: hypothetical protein CMO80_11850 [Verrucomicrobiales bacterium]|nr:hypothetical protein [Verrucomicrobiales bacterium]|tara:strand:- start:2781 stop:3149 length:369 start_codon:yes stop_codon:yes gene_type:complete